MGKVKNTSGWLEEHNEITVKDKKTIITEYKREMLLSRYRYIDYRGKKHRIILDIFVMPNFRNDYKGWIYYIEASTKSGKIISGVESYQDFGKVYNTAEEAKKAVMKDFKMWLENYFYSISKITK